MECSKPAVESEFRKTSAMTLWPNRQRNNIAQLFLDAEVDGGRGTASFLSAFDRPSRHTIFIELGQGRAVAEQKQVGALTASVS